jgi:LSD1 subclass zinc finger protein
MANFETQILCQQCTAVLPVEPGTHFVTCAFCDTTNFVDKSRAILHYAVHATVQEDEALAALRRWMAGNATVKGLDSKAQLEPPRFEYFPMWQVRVVQGGQEQVFMEPAAALSISELKHLTVPAADLQPYDHQLDRAAIAPSVPYETMRHWLTAKHDLSDGAIREVSLVHVPIYLCKYEFDGRRYTAVVDAATSKVFANIFPAKWEVPYVAIGAVAFVIYFCAASIPLGGYLFGDGSGLAIGAGLYCVAAIVLAIPVFIGAVAISAKV